MNKKGNSIVIFTFIMIILALIASWILWVVIQEIINSESAEEISLETSTLDVKIQNAEIQGNKISVDITRNSGKGELTGMIFTFFDGESSELQEIKISLKENETKNFSFNLNKLNLFKIKTISIAPVSKSNSGKEILGRIVHTYNIKTRESGGAAEVCGNKILETEEQCDDGNTNNGDGCSYICEIEPGPKCEFTNAFWSVANAVENEIVTLTLEGTDCNGQLVNFEVLEYDILSADDPVNTNPTSVTFIGSRATATWTAEYQDGDFIDSRYHFISSLSSDASTNFDSGKSDNKLLSVTNAPFSENHLPQVSAIGYDAVDADTNTQGLQVYENTTATYSGSASDMDEDLLSWEWIYTINNGPEIVFLNGTGLVKDTVFTYVFGTAGKTYTWILRATDGALSAESQLKVDILVPSSSKIPAFPEPITAILIESANSQNYVDSLGRMWQTDNGFIGGSTVDRGNIEIANTNDNRIYQTERWGLSGYSITIPNSVYTVNLHFAETYSGVTSAGQRVFSVNVEGQDLSNLDVYAETGERNMALVKTFSNVNVQDGKLDITFTKNIQNTMINGIEIISDGSIPPKDITSIPTPEPDANGRINAKEFASWNAFFAAVASGQKGYIEAGNHKLGGLQQHVFDKGFDVACENGAVLDFEDNVPNVLFSVGKNLISTNCNFKNFKVLFWVASDKSNDGVTRLDLQGSLAPVAHSTIDQISIVGSTFQNCVAPVSGETGEGFFGVKAAVNAGRGDEPVDPKLNPRIERIEIRNTHVEQCGGGFRLAFSRFGQVIIEDNTAKDLQTKYCFGGSGDKSRGSYCGRWLSLGQNHNGWQAKNGPVLIKDNDIRGILDTRGHNSGEGPQVGCFDLRMFRGGEVVGNHCEDVVWIDAEHSPAPTRESWGHDNCENYAKAEDLLVHDNTIKNVCASGEGSGWTSKSGSRPIENPTEETVTFNVMQSSPSGRRTRIDNNDFYYGLNNKEGCVIRGPDNSVGGSSVNNNRFHGFDESWNTMRGGTRQRCLINTNVGGAEAIGNTRD